MLEKLEVKFGDVDKNKSGKVHKLQKQLADLGLYKGKIDGKFFDQTLAAVNEFRKSENLKPISKTTQVVPIEHELNFPSAAVKVPGSTKEDPTGKTALTPMPEEARRNIFGSYKFKPGQAIEILNDVVTGKSWVSENIVVETIPQLIGIPLYTENGEPHKSGKVSFHRLAMPQLKRAFEEIERAGLLGKILSYSGTFEPRYVRGSDKNLSNHAYGTAIDLNADFNGLGKTPAKFGERGSVRELVPIFEAFGFYWGGYFSRPDGMHFEVAKIMDLIPDYGG
jgi:hypothetical protein